MISNISKQANIPSRYGKLIAQVFQEGNKEHLVVQTDNLNQIPDVRIHSECLTGDVFHSIKCDCGGQIDEALKNIQKNGGMIIYLRQEGRDIGLLNKINAYSLQDQGYDTVDANKMLGFKEDHRSYEIVDDILEYYKIKEINLMSNNPKKLNGLKKVKVNQRISIEMKSCKENKQYLNTKKNRLGHMIDEFTQ